MFQALLLLAVEISTLEPFLEFGALLLFLIPEAALLATAFFLVINRTTP